MFEKKIMNFISSANSEISQVLTYGYYNNLNRVLETTKSRNRCFSEIHIKGNYFWKSLTGIYFGLTWILENVQAPSISILENFQAYTSHGRPDIGRAFNLKDRRCRQNATKTGRQSVNNGLEAQWGRGTTEKGGGKVHAPNARAFCLLARGKGTVPPVSCCATGSAHRTLPACRQCIGVDGARRSPRYPCSFLQYSAVTTR